MAGRHCQGDRFGEGGAQAGKARNSTWLSVHEHSPYHDEFIQALVADGHKLDAPPGLTYDSVVSRESARVALTLAALNDLQVMASDIESAYLMHCDRDMVVAEIARR